MSETVQTNSSLASDQLSSSDSLAGFVFEAVNTTTKTVTGAVIEEAQRRLALNGTSSPDGFGQEQWTGIGLEWLRSLLGRREWTLPCVDVKVRL